MVTKQSKILILEDNPLDAQLILRHMKRANIKFKDLIVKSKAEYVAGLAQFRPDIIFSDHTLPTITSVEALDLAIECCGKIPFILVTGTLTEDFAIEIMKKGAWDYVPKSHLERLPGVYERAMYKFEQQQLRQNFLFDLIRNEANVDEAEHIANYGSWELDILSGKLKLSKKAYSILGYLRGDPALMIDAILKILHPDELARVELFIKDVANVTQPDVYSDSFLVIDNKGTYRQISTKFVFKLNAEGNPVKVNGIIRDLTDAESIERRLDESNKRFAALADSLPATAVLTLNAFGNITALNEGACHLLNFTETELNNKHVSFLYGDLAGQNKVLTEYLTVFRDTPLEIAGIFKTKSGVGLSGGVHVTGLRDKEGTIFGFLLVIRNLLPVSAVPGDLSQLQLSTASDRYGQQRPSIH